jgi:Ca2+-binding RTX toxin-like protein
MVAPAPVPYFAIFKVGMSLGLEIWDRTRPDPLDIINNKLTELLQNSVALLDKIDTLQASHVATTLGLHETSIREALYNLGVAQTSGNSATVEHAARNALDLSLHALVGLTTLANNTNGDQFARVAVIPLLFSALSTRLSIVRNLEDGATASSHKGPLNDAVKAIRAADSDLYNEFEESVLIDVTKIHVSGYHGIVPWDKDWWIEHSVTMNFISNLDENIQSASFIILMNWEEARSIARYLTWPDPNATEPFLDTKAFLDWGERNNVDLHAMIAPYVSHDLRLSGYNDMLTFMNNVDHLTSGEWLLGTRGADELISDQSAEYTSPDTLDGLDGNDTLKGGGGDDALRGGSGDDVLAGGRGDDIINGGDGQDRAVYSGSVGVTISLMESGPQDTGHGKDTLINIEDITSGSGNDYLVGTDFKVDGHFVNSHFISGAGDDRMYGGGGNDTFEGGAGNDRLRGGSGNDVLNGGDGNDYIHGAAGVDTAIFSGASIKVDVSLSGWQQTGQGSDYLYSIENVVSGGGNDILLGSSAENSLISGAGNDLLKGQAGNDTLNGGADDDSIYGGAGSDTAVFAAASPDIIVAKAARGLTLISVDGSDFVADDVENFAFSDRTLSYAQTAALAAPVLGSNLVFRTTVGSVQSEIINGFEGPDWVEAGHGDDLVNGGKGADVLIGGAGHDELIGDRGNDRLVGQDGDDMVAGGQGADLLIGGAGHDILIGDRGNDRLFGQDGNDFLNGGQGADALHGDGDNDTLIGLGGADTLYGGDGDDNLSGNAANDLVYGGDGADILNGGQGADEMHGDGDNDTITGLGGNDTLYGGAGDDNLNGNAANDTVYGDAGNDIIEGGQGADNLFGGDGDDVISASVGFDTLFGGIGDDELNGNAGNDFINGGLGDDLLSGGTGADTFEFLAGDRHDTIRDFGNNVDTIQLDASLAADFAALRLLADVVDGNLVITFDANTSLTLNNVGNINALSDDVTYLDLI